MLGIVFDTSTERGVVAIVNNETILWEEHLPVGLQTAQSLLPRLHEGLSSLQMDIKSIAYIACGIGPGSYTGIRIAATAAKTLAFACDIPLIGICTLDAFITETKGSFAAVIDAKIGGVYIQKSGKGENPQVCTLDEAVKFLNDIETIVTPNAEKIRPKLEALSSPNRWNWEENYPSCQQLAKLALKQIKEGKEPTPFELLYMRKTQAEIEKDNLQRPLA